MSEARPLTVIIVDDEAPARRRMKELLADCASSVPVQIAGEAANGRAAVELACATSPDVVLLDVRMPQMDGIEAAQHLQKLPSPPAVIFTTAYDSYAIKAFEVNAVDYLLKPVRAERLAHALRKARPLTEAGLEAMEARPRSHLSVFERGRILLVPIDEVIFLRAELKYVTVRTAEREYLVDEALTRLEQEFATRFVRIHRSCLVAKAHVAGFEKTSADEGEAHWVVLLKGTDERLPVSRRQHHVIRELAS